MYFCNRKRQATSIMVSKNNYKTIYSSIKRDIELGEYTLGTLMPTETILSTNYNVSRPTIAKVYNQLQKEGYLKKKKGRGTVVTYSNKSQNGTTYGFLLPGAGESEIFSLINQQFMVLSRQMHFDCLWDGATASNADVRKSLIESCCKKYIDNHVDGIFFSPLELVNESQDINGMLCKTISDAGIPLVLIDRDIVPVPQKSQFDVVGIDNYSAGMVMAQHLIKAGCQNIYFFYRPWSAFSVTIRLQAVREAVISSGNYFYDTNIFCGDPKDRSLVKTIPIISGKTGIICANDATAALLMSTIDAEGYTCGHDYLLCGFDDMKYSKNLKTPLTSYVQPCEEIANISLDVMRWRIKTPNHEPASILLTGRIVERESTTFA